MLARTLFPLLVFASLSLAGNFAAACGPYGDLDEDAIVDRWFGPGPRGLDRALEMYDNVEDDEARAALEPMVDRVAGQRGAVVSRLYWYTDLQQAQAAAAASHRPILSLRLLGKLTDEFSCANSRFFRTALYSNKHLSDYLRDHFVLHWQSVRPVPRVTIDFGDGRKIQRTVTGNSAHYVLDENGRPLDVLPGLYGPAAFQAWLERSEQFLLASKSGGVNPDRLAEYHARQIEEIDARFAHDAAAIAAAVTSPDELTDAQWTAIAALHAEDAALDGASVQVMRREHPDAFAAGRLALSKRVVEDPILQLVRTFESSLALDAVKNEYTLHRQAHQWFVAGQAPADLDSLNQRVYAELFLTPSSDPWLGLAPAGVYTALEGDGINFATE